MKPIKTVRFGEPFLLMTEIKNEAPYALKFKNTYLNLVYLHQIYPILYIF